MAMSNFDLLAFNFKGEPCDGTFRTHFTKARIYKNWLYIENPHLWVRSESSYIRPTIAQIGGGGHINLGRMDIVTAWDEHQRSIFVCCTSHHYPKKDKHMVGIGCYGYMNTSRVYAEMMGLDPNLDWEEITTIEDGKESVTICRANEEDGILEEHEVPQDMIIEDSWIGVDNTTYANFLRFLKEQVKEYVIDAKYLDLIKKQDPVRFNQGDAFFAKHLGYDVNKTLITKADAPVINGFIGKNNVEVKEEDFEVYYPEE